MVAHDYAVMIVDQLIPCGGPEQAAAVDDGSAHLRLRHRHLSMLRHPHRNPHVRDRMVIVATTGFLVYRNALHHKGRENVRLPG